MTIPENTKRRAVLKTAGAGAAGGVVLTRIVSGSPSNNFGYVEKDSDLVEETVTLSGPPSREKVPCDAGASESESRIKTEVWDVDEYDEQLYLLPSGYNAGDRVEVGGVFLECTRNPDIEGEVTVTKK
jgi:hypothetical protein